MAEQMKRQTEVAIIGGGVIGTATAYYLAKEGKDVTLIERKELASEASGAAFGSVRAYRIPFAHPLATLFTWGTAEKCLHLSEELGRDIEYERCGSVITDISEADVDKWKRLLDERHERGYPGGRIIGKDEIPELEPNIRNRTPYAYVDEVDGCLNNLFLVTALGDKARELGVTIYEHTEVLDVKVKKGQVKSVITDKGEIRAEYIVNACGLWGREIGEMVGLKVPITPMRCELIVTEELPSPIVRREIVSGGYYAFLETKEEKGEVYVGPEKTEIYPICRTTQKGNVLIGITEGRGEAKWATFEDIQLICEGAVELVPALKDVNIIRTFGNLYAMTPDRFPIIGPVAGLEGFIMACGFNDYGIMWGPMAGQVVSELICTGETSIPISEFSFSRFVG